MNLVIKKIDFNCKTASLLIGEVSKVSSSENVLAILVSVRREARERVCTAKKINYNKVDSFYLLMNVTLGFYNYGLTRFCSSCSQ